MTTEAGSEGRVHGVRIADPFGIIDRRVWNAIHAGWYEAAECIALQRHLRPGDRVLDIGAGCGVTSVVAARVVGEDAVRCIEANPRLKPLIEHVAQINGFTRLSVLSVAAAGASEENAPFHIAESYWASSVKTPTAAAVRAEITVPAMSLPALLADFPANVLSVDVEGGEADLFAQTDLAAIDLVIVELHPEILPPDDIGALYAHFIQSGLFPDPQGMTKPHVAVFRRPTRVRARPKHSVAQH